MSDERQLRVLAHHLEPEIEVYRLAIGYVETVEVPEFDEDGEPVTTTDDEGVEVPVTTRQEVVVPVEDFVFAAFDERWEGKGPDEIVAEQKRLVRAALRERETAAAEPKRLAMPGVGDPL